MCRKLLTSTAIVLGLALTSAAIAGPKSDQLKSPKGPGPQHLMLKGGQPGHNLAISPLTHNPLGMPGKHHPPGLPGHHNPQTMFKPQGPHGLPGYHQPPGGPGSNLGYHLTHGIKFSGGYRYHGLHHRHWTHRCWWNSYGCFVYWCPATLCWYYWYTPDSCYYPVTYIRTAIPVAEAVPIGVPTGVTVIINGGISSPGDVQFLPMQPAPFGR
jgi:hypothetical protein